MKKIFSKLRDDYILARIGIALAVIVFIIFAIVVSTNKFDWSRFLER